MGSGSAGHAAHERPADLSLDPFGRFFAAGRGSARDRRSRGRLDPCRRDGRAFRAQSHDRARRGEGAAAAHRQALRRASDGRAGRQLARSLRRGRGRHHHRPSRGRAAYPPHGPGDPGAGQEAGHFAQSRHAGQDARLPARGYRPGAGDERQSRLRRAELHRQPAQEDRGDPEADRPDGARRSISKSMAASMPRPRGCASMPGPMCWSRARPASRAGRITMRPISPR